MDEQTKHIIDLFSLGTVVATLTNILPAIAAIVSIVWGCIRIYETQTVQRLLTKKE